MHVPGARDAEGAARTVRASSRADLNQSLFGELLEKVANVGLEGKRFDVVFGDQCVTNLLRM